MNDLTIEITHVNEIGDKKNVNNYIFSHALERNNLNLPYTYTFSFYHFDAERYLIESSFKDKVTSKCRKMQVVLEAKQYDDLVKLLDDDSLFIAIVELFIFAAAEQLKGDLLGGIN